MLGDIIKLYPRDNCEHCLHLSAGTHPKVAVLLLLGCTRYPATSYQTILGKSSQAAVPFELDLFIRKHLLEEDRSWTKIAFESPAEVPGFEALVGKSKPFLEAVDVARRAAPHSLPVLLLGESGVGKELFARAIHNASGREKDKFVAVNCAAIPFELFEAEMFGTIKGSASDVAERGGYFKVADKGTLFLDEIGDMALGHQAKLLRVIESYKKGEDPTVMRVERVGEPGMPKMVDVRIVAAANEDLQARDVPTPFRQDLYQRLSVLQVLIPPLRARRDDVRLLAENFLAEINPDTSKRVTAFEPRKLSDGALRHLRKYEWPGNVRELRSILWRAVFNSAKPELSAADIDREIVTLRAQTPIDIFSRMREPGFKLDERLDLIQKFYIEGALNETGGNQREAAKLLRINYQTLYKRIHRLGIRVADKR